MNPTPQAGKLLKFLSEFQQEHQRRPTYEEIEKATGINRGTVPRNLKQLISLGLAERVTENFRQKQGKIVITEQGLDRAREA